MFTSRKKASARSRSVISTLSILSRCSSVLLDLMDTFRHLQVMCIFQLGKKKGRREERSSFLLEIGNHAQFTTHAPTPLDRRNLSANYPFFLSFRICFSENLDQTTGKQLTSRSDESLEHRSGYRSLLFHSGLDDSPNTRRFDFPKETRDKKRKEDHEQADEMLLSSSSCDRPFGKTAVSRTIDIVEKARR